MKIIETRKPLEAKCPICHKTFKEWYCPLCGLPISTFHRKRPEDSSSEYQLCDKCNTPNPYGAKYCKNCGENIALHAKDKNGHGWIDLGLSVLWSTESIDGYYYWMDTVNILNPNFYDLFNYRKEDDLINRIIAGKDTASYKWGDKWRMPTNEDFKELIEKCTWELVMIPFKNRYIETKNIQALKITGPNGNHILLPKLGSAKGRYILDSWTRLSDWHPEIDEFDFGYWSSTKAPEKNSAFVFNPRRLRGISPKLSEKAKERILEIQRLHFSPSTPINEKMNLFMQVESYESSYRSAYSIRPVADKKWQGKL